MDCLLLLRTEAMAPPLLAAHAPDQSEVSDQ